MAVKTITIDLEAYGLLARHKRAGESFSQVIKHHFGRTPTVATFRRALGTLRLDPGTVDAMETLVRRRKASPARAAIR